MDLLESGPERPPRRPVPRGLRRALGVALAAGAVGAVAAAQLAGDDAQPGPAAAPSASPSPRATPAPVTAATTGISTTRGRLRVRLLLQGPPSAPIGAVRAWLPDSTVERDSRPAAFTAEGTAPLVLDVVPECPAAVDALGRAHLHVEVDEGNGPVDTEVPLSGDAPLADAVRERCAAQRSRQRTGGPPARLGEGGSAALRAVVDVRGGARGLTVAWVAPGPGVRAQAAGGLPLRVPPGDRRSLRVDLRGGACVVEASDRRPAPFVLGLSDGREVEPVPDRELAATVRALRVAACRGGPLAAGLPR